MLVEALIVTVTLATAAPPVHPVEFWREIAKQQYQPPAGADLEALAGELSDLLGSPDPELRDSIAYSTLATWIYETRILGPEVVRKLAARWRANLTERIGETGTDAVLRRSFSALMLSVVVARDNAAPFLSAEEFEAIATSALAYLDGERDLRGYDPEKGWMHSVAHTADLLKFLARSRYLHSDGQAQILDAVERKCTRAGIVFTFGEDERLARAVLSVINRGDFDRDLFAAWTVRMRPARPAERPSPTALSSAQNCKNVLVKLEAILALDAQPSPSVRSAREYVLTSLKDLF